MINIKLKTSLNDYRSHTIEIKPNSQMRNYLEGCFGYNRHLYNKCLVEYKKNIYSSGYDLKYEIDRTQDKWESKYPSCIRNMATDRFWKAIENCTIHEENTHAKSPKFKSKYEPTQSFTYDCTKHKDMKIFRNNGKKLKIMMGKNCGIKHEYREIRLTKKLRFKGKVKQVHIFREYGRYFANFVVEVDKKDLFTDGYREKKQSKKQNKQPIIKKDFVGLDLGIRTFIKDSENMYLKHITKTKRMKKLIKDSEFYRSEMSRKHVKGVDLNEQSKNYHKTRTKFMRTLRKIANIKDNFYHQLTRWYSDRYTNIVLEDLDNKEMRKRRIEAGQEKIGKVVRPLIAQVSYFKLKQLFDEKSNRILVDKWFPSTQKCSCCGHVKTGKDKLELGEKVYVCNICGLTINRDYNAALNIKMEGAQSIGRGIYAPIGKANVPYL